MRILVWLVLASLASTPATQVRPAHAAAPDVTLTVTVTPSTIRPGESSRVRIRLLSGGRVLAPAVGTFIVNVTITTLGDLALAKRTWVQEEIKERRLSVFWPPAGASTEMSPIGTEADIRAWRLPPAISSDLARQLKEPAPKTAALSIGRTTEFFLMRGERGITQLEFSFAPGFGSGTFFIYAEMKGKPPSSGVLRLERPRSERRTVALAAPEPRVSVTFEYAGRADSQQPPLRPFKYFFMLRASRALEADCEIRLTVERGPMEFLSEGGPTESLSPQKQVWILRGDETSASFMIVSKESADFTEQRPVRITAQPTAGCAQAAPAEQTFKVPPRIVRGVVFQPFVSRVPGNGRIPVILTVRVRDDLGSTPTPGRYGFESVLLQLQPQLSGRRFGWLAEIPGNPKLIRKDEPIEATWKLIGTGHFLVSVTARVRQGDVEEEFKSEVPLGFYFPYSLFLIGLIGAVPALIIRKRRRAVVAAIVSEVVVLGGFLGILREEFVVNSPVDISLVPWYFDVAVGVVALAIGSMIAFGSSLWRPLQGPGRTGCRTRRRDG